MLAHSLDRLYVVTKFILPMLNDLKLSSIKYDKEYNYLWCLDDQNNDQIKENIKDLLLYGAKLRPYMAFYKTQIKAHNNTAHHILQNEVNLILPKFPKTQNIKKECRLLILFSIHQKNSVSLTGLIFSRNTSFHQSTWHGFFWCMGKCYTSKDTLSGWCLWNIILYNIFEFVEFWFWSCQCFCYVDWYLVNWHYLDRC